MTTEHQVPEQQVPEQQVPEQEAFPAAPGMADDERLYEVRLLRSPLRLWARSEEHHAELMREFALLAMDPPIDRPGHDVPKRLLDLIDLLGRRFGGTVQPADAVREEAMARGDASADLLYQTPRAAADAAVALGAMLDEADEFCRQGDLLTLATPADQLAFRQWYLDEFVRQMAGAEPSPWPGPLD